MEAELSDLSLILPAGKLQTTLRLLFWTWTNPYLVLLFWKAELARQEKDYSRQFLYSMKPKGKVFGGEWFGMVPIHRRLYTPG